MVSRPTTPSTSRVEPITSQQLAMPLMLMMNSTSLVRPHYRRQRRWGKGGQWRGYFSRNHVPINNNITVTAGDDGIHASGDLVIDSGTYTVKNSTEGLEGKSITINGGDISIYSTDDGVNAANKNAQQSEIFFTMNGGNLTVEVGQGYRPNRLKRGYHGYRWNH